MKTVWNERFALHKMPLGLLAVGAMAALSTIDMVVRVSGTFAMAVIDQTRQERLTRQSREKAITCRACFRPGDQ